MTKLSLLPLFLVLSGCSLTGSPDFLAETRGELITLQSNEGVKLYALDEMRKAENTTIAAVKAWNEGNGDEANALAARARSEIDQAYKVAEKEAALGLDKESWEQRRFLQQQREQRLEKVL